MTTSPSEAGPEHHQQERVAEKFGAAASEWRDTYTRPTRAADYVLLDRKRYATEFVGRLVPPGSPVLDAGCGAGLAALDLARAGYTVHGVDVASDMIDLARALFREHSIPTDSYKFTCSTLEDASLPDGSFGGIVALGFIQYQVDEIAALRLLHRLLAPGGILVITGPVKFRLTNYLGVPLLLRGLLETVRVLPPRSHPGRVGRHKYSVGRLAGLLQAAGFEVLDHLGHGFAEFDYVSPLIGPRGDLALHRALTVVSRVIPLSRWANDLVFVSRKPH